MKKLNKIVFVDDDRNANEYHELISREADVAHEITSFTSSDGALDYLTYIPFTYKFPELIFINVHIAGGYRFIPEVRRLKAFDENHTRLSYLINTLCNADITAFLKYGMKHFYFKTLDLDMARVVKEIFRR